MCVGLQVTMIVVILQSLLSMEPVITRSVAKQEAIRNFQPKGSRAHQKVSVDHTLMDYLRITLDNHRKHIWTYAVGFSEASDNLGNCPCAAI